MRGIGRQQHLLKRGVFAAAAAAFTPADLAPTLWLTAGPAWCYQDAAGVVPCGVGDPVRLWRDASGHAADYGQAAAGKMPTLRLVAGRWCVRFDGSDDLLAGGPAVSRPFTAVLRSATLTGATGRSLSGDNTTVGNNWLLGAYSGHAHACFVGAFIGGFNDTFDAAKTDTGLMRLADSEWRLDGTSQGTDANTNTPDALFIGGTSPLAGSQEPGKADVYHLIVCPGELTGDDLTNLEAWVAAN